MNQLKAAAQKISPLPRLVLSFLLVRFHFLRPSLFSVCLSVLSFFYIYPTLSSSALFSCPSMSRSAVCYCSHFLCSLYLTWILVLNLMISCLPLSFHWLSWPLSLQWQQWKSYSIWWLLDNFGLCEKLGSVLHFVQRSVCFRAAASNFLTHLLIHQLFLRSVH